LPVPSIVDSIEQLAPGGREDGVGREVGSERRRILRCVSPSPVQMVGDLVNFVTRGKICVDVLSQIRQMNEKAILLCFVVGSAVRAKQLYANCQMLRVRLDVLHVVQPSYGSS
jgi:hypothetical protein